jgi:hypothetical protein
MLLCIWVVLQGLHLYNIVDHHGICSAVVAATSCVI